MRAEQFNHAVEAANALVRAQKQGSDELGDNLRLDALVHANLAIAEQQRIANLIALVKTQGDGEARDALWEDVGEGFGATYRLRASIGEALGL